MRLSHPQARAVSGFAVLLAVIGLKFTHKLFKQPKHACGERRWLETSREGIHPGLGSGSATDKPANSRAYGLSIILATIPRGFSSTATPTSFKKAKSRKKVSIKNSGTILDLLASGTGTEASYKNTHSQTPPGWRIIRAPPCHLP